MPVTNKSRWLGVRATAVMGEPSAARPPETLNQLPQPPVASHEVEKIPPSAPVTNRSSWLGVRATAVIGDPSAAATPLISGAAPKYPRKMYVTV